MKEARTMKDDNPAREMSIAEIAEMQRLALDLQSFAQEKGYTQEQLVNCVISMTGGFLEQMSPKMQTLAIKEIFYVAKILECPIKRFN